MPGVAGCEGEVVPGLEVKIVSLSSPGLQAEIWVFYWCGAVFVTFMSGAAPAQHWATLTPLSPPSLQRLCWPGQETARARGAKLTNFKKNCSTWLWVLTGCLEEKYWDSCWDAKQGRISPFSQLRPQSAGASQEMTESAQWPPGSRLQTSRQFSRPGGVWAGPRLTENPEAALNCSNWQGEGNISATPITALGLATHTQWTDNNIISNYLHRPLKWKIPFFHISGFGSLISQYHLSKVAIGKQ